MKLLLFQLKYAAIDKVEQVLLHLLYLYLTGSTVNDESTFDMNCPSPILFSEVDRHNRDEGIIPVHFSIKSTQTQDLDTKLAQKFSFHLIQMINFHVQHTTDLCM